MKQYFFAIRNLTEEMVRRAEQPINEWMREEKLRATIANHQCSRTENGECECVIWKEQLRQLQGVPQSIII